MAIVSATEGSPTKTGWKRRSSAASFSMCLRYSSRVVAPIQRQLAASEHRLQHVGRVDGALGGARADDRVQLVDEEDDLALGLPDVLEDGLQPLLELAAVLRAGEKRADVERPDPPALEPLGDVARDDALGETLDDGGLADARVADEDGVVLRPAREHLDDTADLLVAPDDGIELAGLGELGEVAAELLERLVGALRILRRHALRAAHLLESGEKLVARSNVEREQEMLGGDVLVVHRSRFVRSAIEEIAESLRCRRLLGRSLHSRSVRELCLGFGAKRRSRNTGALDERARKLLVEERDAEVLGVDLGVAAAARKLLRGGDRLSRLDRQPVEVHLVLSGRSFSRR